MRDCSSASRAAGVCRAATAATRWSSQTHQAPASAMPARRHAGQAQPVGGAGQADPPQRRTRPAAPRRRPAAQHGRDAHGAGAQRDSGPRRLHTVTSHSSVPPTPTNIAPAWRPSQSPTAAGTEQHAHRQHRLHEQHRAQRQRAAAQVEARHRRARCRAACCRPAGRNGSARSCCCSAPPAVCWPATGWTAACPRGPGRRRAGRCRGGLGIAADNKDSSFPRRIEAQAFMATNPLDNKAQAWSALFSEPMSELVKRYTASVDLRPTPVARRHRRQPGARRRCWPRRA